ncbi:MAG TPA: hypothetical protein VLS93_16235 [Anaeromyxobacteraceae bacterium]|nr:hypothetical protein [Anaeromyxobacteraceae bacterium]
MKKLSAIVAVVLSLFLLVPTVASAESVKGTIKQVDAKAGTITFAREGKKEQEVLTVDKAVDLGKVKANSKARLTLEGGLVKEIKAEPSAGGY